MTYLRDRWGMYILDARNPASPHRVASWGTDIAGVKVRGNHCYVAQGSMGSNSLYVLNVSNPASPWQEGVLSGTTGEGIYLVDTFAFLPGFDVVNVADSSRPRLVGHVTAGGYEAWVPGPRNFGVTAGWTGGLRLLNLDDIANPTLDTAMLGTYACADISVKGGIACIASQQNYMMLFDVSNPALPREVGRYVAPGGGMESVLSMESLAFVPAYSHTHDTVLHSVDIRNPSNPFVVGSVGGWESPSAMVLRDSFLYAAEPYRFEVFNVANPRQPVWRGRCNLQEASSDVVVRDSLAYVTSLPSAIINVRNPSQPVVIGTISSSAYGIAVYDTFAYLAVNYGGLEIWSIATPQNPYRIDTVSYPRGYEVEVSESLLLYGGLDFRVLDLASPARPGELGFYATPYRTRKVAADGQYIYAACFMAGVCVLEYLPSGISEGRNTPRRQRSTASVLPNPTHGVLSVSGLAGMTTVNVFDAIGKEVMRDELHDGSQRLDLTRLPAGLYFVEIRSRTARSAVKVVKQ